MLLSRPRVRGYPSFEAALKLMRCPPWEAEFRFATERRWRADYAWPLHGLLVEVDGGAFVGGRHIRGAGFRADLEKLNAAALLGYRVLRYLPEQLLRVAVPEVLGALGVKV